MPKGKTQMSDADHAKRQKAAADATLKLQQSDGLPPDTTHPLVNSQLTTREHVGKIPEEPHKPKDLSLVNLETNPPATEIAPGAVTTVQDANKAAKASEKATEATRSAQEKGVKEDIKAAEKTTAAEEKAHKARPHATARGARATPARKRFGKNR